MVMTDEMRIWDRQFQDYLETVDIKYADYFSSNEAQEESITVYFGTHNGGNLKYYGKNLRRDIYNEVIEKHKEIWGEWHRFDIL